MPDLVLSQSGFDRIKRRLREALPAISSAHRTEAAARGLGFGSNAALRVRLAEGTARVPLLTDAFDAFLLSKGHYPVWSELTYACAAEALLAVSAAHPDLGREGFGAVPDGHPRDAAAAERLEAAGTGLFSPLAIDGFITAWKHLTVPYRLSALAGTHRVEDLQRIIQDSESADIPAGSLLAAAIHVGIAVQRGKGTTSLTVVPPATSAPHAEAWIARAIDEGEAMKEGGRDRLRLALEAGRFDAVGAEEVIKALWARAFSVRLDKAGIPTWKSYGRMLLADPELAAFGLRNVGYKAFDIARRGIAGLCGGGPLPGVAPGYTYVFEGELGARLNHREAA